MVTSLQGWKKKAYPFQALAKMMKPSAQALERPMNSEKLLKHVPLSIPYTIIQGENGSKDTLTITLEALQAPMTQK
jgi:hypothetical protein